MRVHHKFSYPVKSLAISLHLWNSKSKMATAPVKPQPLHNFPLSSLKWGQTTHHHHHHHHQQQQPPPPSSSSDNAVPIPKPPRIGSRSARHHRLSFAPCTTSVAGTSNQLTPSGPEPQQQEHEDDVTESSPRPWKLRPRKPNGNDNTNNNNNNINNNNNDNSNASEGVIVVEKKKKRAAEEVEDANKLCIALSREEIEEDVFVLTGSRPSRRPKKRPKNLQKVLDCVFPGLWLVGATADTFRILDAQVKR